MKRDLDVLRSVDSEFSYECGGCSRCCYKKGIAVNPYEVARLARGLGTRSERVREDYLDPARGMLKQRADGSCVFLGPDGCRVHPDRPLVCRLYPLGRAVMAGGEEVFVEVQPHPETAGRYGSEGTVAAYLRAQGAEPYLDADARYAALLARFRERLAGRGHESPEHPSSAEPFPADPTRAMARLMDFDRAVAAYARSMGATLPSTLDEQLELHLNALSAWVEGRFDPAQSA